MRIAIVGTRGLPPTYGGYETVADHFVRYFVEKGHEVIVACEKPANDHMPESYKGAKLVYFPFKPPMRYSLRKIYEGLNDLFFYFSLARRCDAMYILAGLGTQVLPLTRLLNPSLKIITNNDGIEWKREKYSWLEKKLWKSFIRSSLRFSNLIVYDNPRLAEYFPKHNLKKAITIDYGVEQPPEYEWNVSRIANFNPAITNFEQLEKGQYYVVVARLQKDNNTHKIIDGYLLSNSDKPLVIIGDSLDDAYQKDLESQADSIRGKNIHFTGGIYDLELLNMLRQHSFAYIHGHSAGGTNPALLEAMVLKKAVIAHNNPFNRHVLDENGLFFRNARELAQNISKLDGDRKLQANLGKNNFKRALNNYTWERCMRFHEKAFKILLGDGV